MKQKTFRKFRKEPFCCIHDKGIQKQMIAVRIFEQLEDNIEAYCRTYHIPKEELLDLEAHKLNVRSQNIKWNRSHRR